MYKVFEQMYDNHYLTLQKLYKNRVTWLFFVKKINKMKLI